MTPAAHGATRNFAATSSTDFHRCARSGSGTAAMSKKSKDAPFVRRTTDFYLRSTLRNETARRQRSDFRGQRRTNRCARNRMRSHNSTTRDKASSRPRWNKSRSEKTDRERTEYGGDRSGQE